MKDTGFVRKLFCAYFLLAAAGAFGGLFFLMTIPHDPKNSWLFGYSLSRILFMLVFFLMGLVFFFYAVKSFQNRAFRAQLINTFLSRDNFAAGLVWGIRFVFLGTILIIISPLQFFGSLQAYVERLYPFLAYFLQLSIQTMLLLNIVKSGSFLQEKKKRIFSIVWMLFSIFLLFMALWGLIASQGFGIRGDKWTVWYEVGVPILALQVGLAIIIAGIITLITFWLSKIIKRKWVFRITQGTGKVWGYFARGAGKTPPHTPVSMQIPKEPRKYIIDIFLVFAVWGTAFYFWNNSNLPPNYFAPKPTPPEGSYLPYSDAASWDMNAQYALIGHGIGRDLVTIDHPAYIGLLSIFHLLVGQDYGQIIMLQVFLFSVFPVILFWLGKCLHSRFMGIFLSGMTILHELNAHASSSNLNLSHSKLLMTEFPTGIGLAALALVLFLLFRKAKSNISLSFPLGAILGILLMIRFNTLLIIVAVIAGIGLFYGKEWKISAKVSTIVLISIFLTISPWMWRSWIQIGNPFFFASKLSLIFNSEFRSAPVDDPREIKNVEIPDTQNEEILLQENINQPLSQSPESGNWRSGTKFRILNHFVHNLITSVLILPTHPIFEYYPANIRDGSLYDDSYFWRDTDDHWLENIPPNILLAIIINLLILAVGLGLSFQYWKLAGFVPLGIYLTYNFSTAMARTSGGRYIVPVTWVVLVYFGLGITQIMIWLLRFFRLNLKSASQPGQYQAFSTKMGVGMMLPMIVFVASLPILENSIPFMQFSQEKSEIYERLLQENIADQLDIDPIEFEEFLFDSNTFAFWGRTLYPRYLKADFSLGPDAYRAKPYPRFVFTFIDGKGYRQAILPLLNPPKGSFHGKDVIVLGCQSTKNLEVNAVMAVFLEDDRSAYSPVPNMKMACPFSDPVFSRNIGH